MKGLLLRRTAVAVLVMASIRIWIASATNEDVDKYNYGEQGPASPYFPPPIQQVPLDPVRIPISRIPYFVHSSKRIYTRQPPHRTAYWAHTNYPFSVVVPPSNNSGVHNITNNEHRRLLWKTSHQARQFQCDILAANGGPFHADGTSCGPVVVNGSRVDDNTSPLSDDWIGLGATDRNWILGSYRQWEKMGKHNHIRSFVSGFQWLVYNGTAVAQEHGSRHGHYNDNRPKKVSRAARTAVGITEEGSLVVWVVDGCEKCLQNQGLSLEEMSNLILGFPEELDQHLKQQQGFHYRNTKILYAINMDGGGSSTLLYQYQVKNRPTCLDVGFISCERPVASVLCLSSSTTTDAVRELSIIDDDTSGYDDCR